MGECQGWVRSVGKGLHGQAASRHCMSQLKQVCLQRGLSDPKIQVCTWISKWPLGYVLLPTLMSRAVTFGRILSRELGLWLARGEPPRAVALH